MILTSTDLLAEDGTWSALGSGMNTTVNVLKMWRGELYAAGEFTNAGGVPANYIAKWDGNSWLPLGTGTNDRILCMAVTDDYLYVGGRFTSAGDIPANRFARWDGNSWSTISGSPNLIVHAIEPSGTSIYIGGRLITSSHGRVYKWSGWSWELLPSPNNLVRDLLISGNDLYIGGHFTTVGGVTANRVARWNGSAWSPLGSGFWNDVYKVAESQGTIYAVGLFSCGINQWNGSSWSSVGGGTCGGGWYFSVQAIAFSGSKLYMGGFFTYAGGPARNIAAWNGSNWTNLGAGVNNMVESIEIDGNDIYAGGQFTLAGGLPANRVAKWNGAVPPAVVTSNASNITSSVALLNATVNPNGFSTTVYFEWGTDNTLSSFFITTSQTVGSGTVSIPLSDNLMNLSANTTYYYRAVGQNAGGTQRGEILSFTTLTLQEHVGLISSQVNEYVTSGILSSGNGNSLLSKLNASVHQINNNNFNAAINQLQAFINQVNAFVQSGRLTQSQAQVLIDPSNLIIMQLSGGSNPHTEIPKEFKLSQNYPNPFNPSTKIQFSIAKSSFTELTIIDVTGRVMAILVNEELKPGTYEVNWDASHKASGVYFYKLEAGEYTQTKKMLLIK